MRGFRPTKRQSDSLNARITNMKLYLAVDGNVLKIAERNIHSSTYFAHFFQSYSQFIERMPKINTFNETFKQNK